jgi:hypothetical protein
MPHRARSRFAAALVRACTERLAYKAAALFFAVALWIVASGGEPVARYVAVRVEPVLDADVRMVDAPPRVRALVVGPAREVMKLSSSPPVVRRAFGESPPESVRVELRAADVDMPRDVNTLVVRDVTPRAFTLHFETLATRRVPVRVAVRAADGALPPETDFVVDPDTVLVRGPQRVVQRLADLPTVPRLVGRGESLGEVALDTAALGVRATPSHVRLLVRTRTPPAAAGASAPDSAARDSATRDSAARARPAGVPVPPDTTHTR